MKKPHKVILGILLKVVLVLLCVFFLFRSLPSGTDKPVIYLYPERDQEITVQIIYQGDLTVLYPNGELKKDLSVSGVECDSVLWHVIAKPDGTVINQSDKREYSYIFWEGIPDAVTYDFSKGYCVAGKDTASFLQEILPQIGLVPQEYNEFIVYWLPLLQDNPYNIISFQTEKYTELAQLKVYPEPDSILRVFMVSKPSQVYVEMDAPDFETFVREGFTVVEWGGTQIR